jgi:HlyD family secretion protein
LPPGIAYGNGRLEADPIDISTKFAGRVFELRVDEGDVVTAGQTVALMDTRDLMQALQKAKAQVGVATRVVSEAQAMLDQLHTQVVFADQEMVRAQELLRNGWVTRELFDQRRQQLDSAKAAELAAGKRINQAEYALQAAVHDVGLLEVNIADNTLVAPRDGRIEYRIANVGEVLPAGGRVFTMLDTGNVYMDVYLPTLWAGRVKIGDDARIRLDAYPEQAIPATATFVAAQAQFTPKMVETVTERDKLMFRVRVRIAQGWLRDHKLQARSGLPGMAYVRFEADAKWPDGLQAGIPP